MTKSDCEGAKTKNKGWENRKFGSRRSINLQRTRCDRWQWAEACRRRKHPEASIPEYLRVDAMRRARGARDKGRDEVSTLMIVEQRTASSDVDRK